MDAIGADHGRVDHAMPRKDVNGLGVALPIWAGHLHPFQKLQPGSAHRQRGVDRESIGRRDAGELGLQHIVHEGAKLFEPCARYGCAGRHGVAASLDGDAGLDRAPHRKTDVGAA